jgi:LmbE family N-acetylglucosaminyl deacetylase
MPPTIAAMNPGWYPPFAMDRVGGEEVATHLGRGGTFALSPHADDVALSLGGSLLVSALPQPVVVLTVFGTSNFMAGGFHDDVDAVTSRRKAEDLAFATAAGVELRFWTYPEASLRTRPTDQNIFQTRYDAPLEEPTGLESELANLLTITGPSLVLAPLGLGYHADHLLVHRLAKRLCLDRQLSVGYYEDLPYAAELSLSAIRARALSVEAALSPVFVGITPFLPAKLRLLGSYPSQLRAEDLARVARHARRRTWKATLRSVLAARAPRTAVERIWCRSSDARNWAHEHSHLQ